MTEYIVYCNAQFARTYKIKAVDETEALRYMKANWKASDLGRAELVSDVYTGLIIGSMIIEDVDLKPGVYWAKDKDTGKWSIINVLPGSGYHFKLGYTEFRPIEPPE